jgi:glutamate/tyrosine decarboxylase-like PLP-dependent enzyme
MNDPQLNIVSFRYNPAGSCEDALNLLNEQLGEAVLADGRFLVGLSRIGKNTVFRPAFSNWRTREEDVDEFAEVVLEIAKNIE